MLPHPNPSSPLLFLLLLLHTTLTLSTPHPLQPRGKQTGNSHLPLCFYNYGGNSVCHGGAPDWANCDNSINVVCTKTSTLAIGDLDFYQFSTGTGIKSGPGADCFAQAGNGKAAVTDYATCVEKFTELKGCNTSTNAGYDANCVGGTINQHVNDLYAGHTIDDSLPIFVLGPTGAFGEGAGQAGPAPQNSPGTADEKQEAVNSRSVSGGSAGSASGGGGRGSTTGGYGGADPGGA